MIRAPLQIRRSAMVPVLSVRGARKSFGAVEALRGVDFDVAEGEVHALCGDNGAGKSTLVKLIAGVEVPDAGTISIRGEQVRFASPAEALAAGVATIHQDLALAPRMAIYENIFMGSELVRRVAGLTFLDKGAMIAQSRNYLKRLKLALPDMKARVETLSGGQCQAVAICRALRWKADIIIMDEPTAALGVRETEQVLDLIRTLKAAGTTIILVSHNMKDVVQVADSVTVLRTGETQIALPVSNVTADDLAHIILSGQTELAA